MATDAAHSIRNIRQVELAKVHVIERMCFPNPWPLHVFQQEFNHSWSRLWGVYTPQGEGPLAYLLFWLVYDEVHILNIATHPEYRRRAIASTLLDKLEQESRKVGARYLTLEVRPSNDAAINLYEREGFQVVGVRPRYYSDNGEDALIMVKEL